MNTVERFWARIDRVGDRCWPWGGARSNGYGYVSWRGRVQPAHRIAWQLTAGPIPAGVYVCHHCDQPACCNPAHLFLGTQTDNMRDCAAKGRTTKGDRNPSRLYPARRPRGEHHGNAKLTAADVLQIRHRKRQGERTRVVAQAFGVSPSHIEYIIRGLSWAHLPC
jgi:hypothetical protein